MRKVFSLIGLVPLTLSACNSLTPGPSSIDIPTPTDAKQKIVVDFYNASTKLNSTQTASWEAVCNRYAHSSFWATDPNGNTKGCVDYHIAVASEGEKLGVKSGLKFWDWKAITGNDVSGWFVPVHTKVETEIINQEKYESHTKTIAATNDSWTQQQVKDIFKTGFSNALKFGTISTYKLLKSGDTYKIEEIINELLRA